MNQRTQILQGLMDLRNRIPQVDLGDMTQDPAIRFAGTRDAVRRMAGMQPERLALPEDTWSRSTGQGGIPYDVYDRFMDARRDERAFWDDFPDENLLGRKDEILDEIAFEKYDKPFNRLNESEVFDVEEAASIKTEMDADAAKNDVVNTIMGSETLRRQMASHWGVDPEDMPDDPSYYASGALEDFLYDGPGMSSWSDIGLDALKDIDQSMPKVSLWAHDVKDLAALPSSRRSAIMRMVNRMGLSDLGPLKVAGRGVGANERMYQMLLDRSDADLAQLGNLLESDNTGRPVEELLALIDRLNRSRRRQP